MWRFIFPTFCSNEVVGLFSKAAAVVGPHGGALSNALFLPPGEDSLVIELGLDSSLFYHYRHAAAALGHEYQYFPLDDHKKGASTPRVSIGEGVADAVAAAIVAKLPEIVTTEEL